MKRQLMHRHRLTHHLIGPLLVLALSACGLMPLRSAPPTLPLLTPATLGSSHSVLQILHGAFGEQEAVFQCVVEVTPQNLTLVGLDARGQRWFTLHYDGSALGADVIPQAPAALDPRRVLSDLQLALWPLAALQQATAGTSWEVSEPTPATRRLRRAGRLIAEVHYSSGDPWQGRLWLSNFETGYSLSVDSQVLP